MIQSGPSSPERHIPLCDEVSVGWGSISLAKPMKKGPTERFNREVRDDLLNGFCSYLG